MPARRCSSCSIDYPPLAPKKVSGLKGGVQWLCHACGEPTSHFSNAEPDNDWKWAVHEAHYRLHDAARAGPTPEALGRQEAFELVDLERRMSG